MTESTEIQPALTPEQWGHWHGENGYLHPHPTDASTGYLGDYTDGHYGYANGHHALAALALHEQPFGFTHEDLARLRAMPKQPVYGDSIPLDNSLEEMVWWDDEWFASLVDRIAALIPPDR